MSRKSSVEPVNFNIPIHLKEWAKQKAESNYQSLSGFLVKLIADAKKQSDEEQENKGKDG